MTAGARRRSERTAAFGASRLQLARRLAGLKKTQLATAIGVSPTAVTQYEAGVSKPSADVAARIALTLGLPIGFFDPGRPFPEATVTPAHFRSLRATTQLERDRAVAFGQLAYEVLATLERHVELPEPQLPVATLDSPPAAADIAAAAQLARRQLDVPAGPVGHVVRLLEVHGVLVLRLPEQTRRVDAFSHYYGERPAIFLNPAKADRARARFDAAHELGHLVMHHDVDPGSRPVENQAHSFAAEFLMPAAEIQADLPRRLDWEQLHAAKRKWGTSLKALAYRARSLELFSEHTYKRAMVQLARWGDPEPGPLGPAESPTTLAAAVELLEGHGTSRSQLADEAGLPLATFEQVVAAGSEPRPTLRLQAPA